MKGLLLGVAALALAGTIGSANAAPLMATDLGIWHGTNPVPGDSTNLSQQALPGARTAPGMSLLSTTVAGAAAGPIFLDGPVSNTVGGFLASGPIVTANCSVSCLGTILSTASFVTSTLFEFSFTLSTSGTLTVMHDDGISLFADLGGGNNPGATNLIPGASAPTNTHTDSSGLLAAGNYDLFYTSANGLPEVLHTNFTAVPAPVIGHGLLVLLAVGGVLFGGKLLESLKIRHSHAA